MHGHLEHDSSASMAIKRFQEGGDVRDIEGDVMADDDIRLGDIVGNGRPLPLELVVADASGNGHVSEGSEHARIVVNGRQHSRSRNEGCTRAPSPASHIEHAPLEWERLAGYLMRAGIGDLAMDREHLHRMTPRRTLRVGEDVGRNGPGAQVGSPGGKQFVTSPVSHR